MEYSLCICQDKCEQKLMVLNFGSLETLHRLYCEFCSTCTFKSSAFLCSDSPSMFFCWPLNQTTLLVLTFQIQKYRFSCLILAFTVETGDAIYANDYQIWVFDCFMQESLCWNNMGSGLFHTIYYFVKINKLWLTGSACSRYLTLFSALVFWDFSFVFM